jgi:predicted nucleic acid-binding protein
VTVLADTSAWIAYQHGTTSAVSNAVRAGIESATIAVTDLVVMEMLAAVRPERVTQWSGLLSRAIQLDQRPWDDAEAAAAIYRACRRGGFTPRSLVDCMIAAVAIRHDVPVLHHNRDYDAIAAHCELNVVRP